MPDQVVNNWYNSISFQVCGIRFFVNDVSYVLYSGKRLFPFLYEVEYCLFFDCFVVIILLSFILFYFCFVFFVLLCFLLLCFVLWVFLVLLLIFAVFFIGPAAVAGRVLWNRVYAFFHLPFVWEFSWNVIFAIKIWEMDPKWA